ncbi:MAG: serine/threonine-protein phosphatase [Bacteroidaceae bacterium]|nr:serine/threonine-protein phosphatase [Bacteroidaceae bacterium]
MDTIIFSGNTDMGQKRSNNEDAFIAQSLWNGNYILAAAIDGVGGYEGGEVASALAQQKIVEYLETYPNGERSELIKQAVVYANNAIFAERQNQPEYGSMSCVLTAVLVEVDKKLIHMAHVGDTRLYQYTYGHIMKLSHDHSLVGYREEIGELTELEAMSHPQRNVISRDVGSKLLEGNESDYVEAATFPLLPNSTLLLCSDGLCDMITSEQMKECIEGKGILKEKVASLIAAANKAGGKDNITVVLIEYNCPDYNPEEVLVAEPSEKSTENDNSVSENRESESQSIEPERALTENSATKNGGGKLVYSILIIFSIVMFVAGYVLGGYTGKEYFPAFFSHRIDSVFVNNVSDSIGEGIIQPQSTDIPTDSSTVQPPMEESVVETEEQ